MSRPQVGVMFPCRLPAKRLLALVQEAERLNLDQVWLVEDCFYGGAVATASAALAASERVTVGIGIMPAVARNPAFLAMDIATMAALHPGRLVVGLGHGMPDWMRQVGAYPQSPLAALEETLTAVRMLLAGAPVTMTGRYVRLRDVQLTFPPTIVPPVLAGVRSPRSLALAGRAADGTILAEPATPEYVRAALDNINLGTGGPIGARAGAGHMIVTYNWLAMDDDPVLVGEQAREALAQTLGSMNKAHLLPLPFGQDVLAAIAASNSPSELAVRLQPAWVDRLTISGDLDRCVAKVRALHTAGSDVVALMPPPGVDELVTASAAGRIVQALMKDG